MAYRRRSFARRRRYYRRRRGLRSYRRRRFFRSIQALKAKTYTPVQRHSDSIVSVINNLIGSANVDTSVDPSGKLAVPVMGISYEDVTSTIRTYVPQVPDSNGEIFTYFKSFYYNMTINLENASDGREMKRHVRFVAVVSYDPIDPRDIFVYKDSTGNVNTNSVYPTLSQNFTTWYRKVFDRTITVNSLSPTQMVIKIPKSAFLDKGRLISKVPSDSTENPPVAKPLSHLYLLTICDSLPTGSDGPRILVQIDRVIKWYSPIGSDLKPDVEQLQKRVEELQGVVEQHGVAIDDHAQSIASLTQQHAALSGTVQELTDTYNAHVAAYQEFANQVQSRLNEFDQRIGSLEHLNPGDVSARLTQLEHDFKKLEEDINKAAGISDGSLASAIAAIGTAVAAIPALKNQYQQIASQAAQLAGQLTNITTDLGNFKAIDWKGLGDNFAEVGANLMKLSGHHSAQLKSLGQFRYIPLPPTSGDDPVPVDVVELPEEEQAEIIGGYVYENRQTAQAAKTAVDAVTTYDHEEYPDMPEITGDLIVDTRQLASTANQTASGNKTILDSIIDGSNPNVLSVNSLPRLTVRQFLGTGSPNVNVRWKVNPKQVGQPPSSTFQTINVPENFTVGQMLAFSYGDNYVAQYLYSQPSSQWASTNPILAHAVSV